MILRKSILISLLILSFINCKTKKMNISVHNNVIEIIKTDSLVLDYLKNELNLNIEDMQVAISDEKIPFNFKSLEVDIIKKDYIDNFNPFQKLDIEELNIVARVSDSLFKKDNEYNSDYLSKGTIQEIKPNTNFILFFSEIKNNELYAHLLPFNNNLYEHISYSNIGYGTSFSFLFKLNPNNSIVIKKYSSILHLN